MLLNDPEALQSVCLRILVGLFDTVELPVGGTEDPDLALFLNLLKVSMISATGVLGSSLWR